MRVLALAGLLLATTACSVSRVPTAPMASLPPVDHLTWFTIAPGCHPRPLPTLTPYQPTTATLAGDTLTLEYRAINPDTAPHTMFTAVFHAIPAEWQLCEWDTTD